MIETEFSIIKALVMFLVTCIVTFIGASTGGVAMFTVPLCIFLGLPVQVSVATTRVGAFFSMFAAFAGFSKYKKIDYKIGIIGSVIAGIGAYLGASWLLIIPAEASQKLIGFLMAVIFVFSFLKKKSKKETNSTPRTVVKELVGYCLFFVIGAVGGVFGGQGIMLVYTLTLFFGLDFIVAAGTRVIISFLITSISLCTYFNSGCINWKYGAVFAVASVMGTYFGAVYSVKKGEGNMEKIFEAIVVITSLKLMFS